MKIFANISEVFFYDDGKFNSKSVSAKFLTKFDDIVIAAPVNDEAVISGDVNSSIDSSCFMALPFFDSAMCFIKRFIWSKKFRNYFFNVVKKGVEESDKVWVRAPSVDSLIVAIVALRMDKPVILHMAGDLDGVWKNPKYSKLQKVLAYLFSKFLLFIIYLLSKSRNVYFLSTGDALNNRYLLSANSSKLFFDTSLEVNDSVHVGKVKSDIIKFLYVGRIEEDKGVFFLVNLIEDLIAYFPKLRFSLTIVGFGSAVKDLNNTIKSKSLANVIDFIGFVPSENLADYYGTHDLLIFPSMAPEGFPRVIQEAWLSSLPVLTTNTGGICGIAKDEFNAFICKAGSYTSLFERVVSIINNPEQLDKIRSNIIDTKYMYSSSHQYRVAFERLYLSKFT